MEPELILRLFLIILGLVFLILSFAGAILELVRRAARMEAVSAPNPLDSITKLAEALGALFAALAGAPLWLGLGGFGIVLILIGALVPFNFS